MKFYNEIEPLSMETDLSGVGLRGQPTMNTISLAYSGQVSVSIFMYVCIHALCGSHKFLALDLLSYLWIVPTFNIG